MKTYTVQYEEQRLALIKVEANSELEAMEQVEKMKQNGEIDSHMEVMATNMIVL